MNEREEAGHRASDPALRWNKEEKMLILPGVNPFKVLYCFRTSEVPPVSVDTCALYVLLKGEEQFFFFNIICMVKLSHQ